MAITYKILGQVTPAASSLTQLYAVSPGYSAATSTLSICNQNATDAKFRIAVQPANAAIQMKHYIAYDSTVLAYDTVALTIGITVAATDVVAVYANTTNISFSLFGSEINT